MLGVCCSAVSARDLSAMLLPARSDTLAVMSSLHSESLMRPGEGIGTEPAEYDRVNRADARATEHGHSGFRDHRHVNGHAIALLGAG